MLQVIRDWYQEYFSDREAVVLVLLLTAALIVIVTMGQVLAPVLTSVVLAYLLQGLINTMTRNGIPRFPAFVFTYMLFATLLFSVLFILVPLTWGQLIRLLNDQFPRFIAEANSWLNLLPARYPDLVSEQLVQEISSYTTTSVKTFVESVVSFSISNIHNVMSVIIFVVLVPLLVFFFLKDKDHLIRSLVAFLPPERPFISRVMAEMDTQISNYVRGKAIEILIVGSMSYVIFVAIDLNYAALLGLLVGLSVIVPYLGATVITIPVAIVGYLQHGWGSEFMWVMIAYAVIQALDGNVLVPILFSEAVNLHPVSIMIAVLVFGGFWGLWGVFFAIPLATLVKAMVTSWPRLELAKRQATEP